MRQPSTIERGGAGALRCTMRIKSERGRQPTSTSTLTLTPRSNQKHSFYIATFEATKGCCDCCTALHLCGDVEPVVSEQLARSWQPISHGMYFGHHLLYLGPILLTDSSQDVLSHQTSSHDHDHDRIVSYVSPSPCRVVRKPKKSQRQEEVN